MKLAYYQENEIGNEKVGCTLCPNKCVLSDGQYGLCKGRRNVGGSIYAINYGLVTSIALDSIEKKPLRNFFPGSMILSVGTFGCNLQCDFCQNWSISQADKSGVQNMEISSEVLIEKAKFLIPEGNIGIAFTYNEPTVWFDYVLDTAILAKIANLKVVLVTNGFINPAPLSELLPYVDAMNIDLKAFNEAFYKKICGGDFQNVKETIRQAVKKTHVEITTMLIPGLNDDPYEIEEMAKWLFSLNPNIVLHLSRYFPCYKRKEPQPTPLEIMEKSQLIAQKYLKNVYLGNVHS